MKELTIEEKAKAYNKIMDRAKKELSVCGSQDCDAARQIFRLIPELAESEDENIKKWIKKELESKYVVDNIVNNVMADKALAWLEKQGQHAKFINNIQIGDKVTRNQDGVLVNISQLNRVAKHADKVEPKFHENEWVVVDDGRTGRIIECTKDFADVDLEFSCLSTSINNIHLWTIQDAKDGDVLAVEPENGYHSPFIAIYKERGLNFFNSHCFISFDGKFNKGTTGHSIYLIHPATKEQRDTLEKAMADAGYTFDFGRKELRKLKFRIGDEIKTDNEESLTITKIDEKGYWSKDLFICGFDDAAKWELVEQKPAWSKEDENLFRCAIDAVEQESKVRTDGCLDEEVGKMVTDWLNSLKDRVQPQLKQEWSIYDETILKALIDHFEYKKEFNEAEDYDIILWLKSLRPQKQ